MVGEPKKALQEKNIVPMYIYIFRQVWQVNDHRSTQINPHDSHDIFLYVF